jgi:Holliday junction DNA helicase RuvA
MISNLKGVIIDTKLKSIIIELNSGIAFEVFMPYRELLTITKDSTANILTELVVKEDSLTLYGFINKSSRDIFKLVQKVSGVGAKMAIAILDNFTPDDLYAAIESGDSNLFKQVSGIGNKLAQKIIIELKGSVNLNSENTNWTNNTVGKIKIDAINALTNLGYDKNRINSVMSTIDSTKYKDIAGLIKEALKLLAK